jgi:hypothetical protein
MPKQKISQDRTDIGSNGHRGSNGSRQPSPRPTAPSRGARRTDPDGEAGVVAIRGLIDDAATSAPLGRKFDDAAIDWSRIVRNRIRWKAQSDARDAQAQHSRDLLQSLNVDLKRLDALATRGVIQVSIPVTDDDRDQAALSFPWEYVLSAATRDGCARPLVVIRHLVRSGPSGAAAPRATRSGAPDPVLILESAPGPIREAFRFDSERKLVAANLPDLDRKMKVLPDPSKGQALAAIKAMKPGLIHLAGVDTHQGAQMLGIDDPGFDGFYLVDERGRPVPYDAKDLGLILASAGRVRLVACNFQDSAARVAAFAVSAGAEAAIGFQDVVDDTMAELFYARLYSNWRENDWVTVVAFARTIEDLRVRPGVLSGLGIVLWSDADAIENGTAAQAAALDRSINVPASRATDTTTAAPDAGARGDPVAAVGVVGVDSPEPTIIAAAGNAADVAATFKAADDKGDGEDVAEDATEPSQPERAAPKRLIAGELSSVVPPPELWVEPTIRSNVNYVLLHNNGSLFESFRLRKATDAEIKGVEVVVTLFVGQHSFPYRTMLSLNQPITEIRDRIRVPLTADILRSVHESIQSVVYVRVRRDHSTIFEDTLPVTLVSPDEWMDTDAQTRWLPSFVLPRDPTVDQVRQRALPALRALDDSRGGGFLGYQAIDPSAGDLAYRGVDSQANAIWSTLSFLYDLSYVNPPPTYIEHAQRLRTPSEVIKSKSGTCIDLALLYAACLEAVDIYPVIVMYDGHANVGYWRSPEFHQAFQTLQPSDATPAAPVASADPVASNGSSGKGARRAKGRAAATSRTTAPPSVAGVMKDTQVDAWEIRSSKTDDDPNLREVRRRVDGQDLVILDATRLTFQDGFAEAAQRGSDGFRDHVFRSLVDIRIARKALVTPLPFRRD